MSNQNSYFSKEGQNMVILLMLSLFLLLISFDWTVLNHIQDAEGDNFITGLFCKLYLKITSVKKNMFMYRTIFLVLFTTFFLVNTTFKLQEEKIHPLTHVGTVIFSLLFIIGYTTAFPVYNLLIFPLVFMASQYFLYKTIKSFKKGGDIKTDSRVSCLPANDLSFEFITDKGLLRIHNPIQGIAIEGGAGSGKSASVIEPIIVQGIEKGHSAFIYDYKGNPPTLGRTAYNALLRAKRLNPDLKLKFAMVNFSDVTRTVRINPLSPKYLKTDLHIKDACTSLMLNLNKSWVEKKDFWAENAISIISATATYFNRHHPDKCTLPHIIAAITSNYIALLDFISQDDHVKRIMQPVIVAHENKAQGQLAGAISSIQLPLANLLNPTIFWALSQDDFSLDISNLNDPKIFCVANDPAIEEAISPCIGVIASIIMKQINQQGKNICEYLVDELPTSYHHKLDNLPATARSNKVIVVLSYQSYAQLERDYGKQNAEVIVGNLGNQFYGMTNESKSAEKVSKMFGDYKYTDYSLSESDSGTSQSMSIKKENIYQTRDIMGQKPGQFAGKIAGGDPAFFAVQMPYIDTDKNTMQTHLINPDGTKEFLWDRKDIPPFALASLPDNIRTGDLKKDKAALEDMVKKNYDKILNEVSVLLEPFMPVVEEE